MDPWWKTPFKKNVDVLAVVRIWFSFVNDLVSYFPELRTIFWRDVLWNECRWAHIFIKKEFVPYTSNEKLP